jgi:hypothetical protein
MRRSCRPICYALVPMYLHSYKCDAPDFLVSRISSVPACWPLTRGRRSACRSWRQLPCMRVGVTRCVLHYACAATAAGYGIAPRPDGRRCICASLRLPPGRWRQAGSSWGYGRCLAGINVTFCSSSRHPERVCDAGGPARASRQPVRRPAICESPRAPGASGRDRRRRTGTAPDRRTFR